MKLIPKGTKTKKKPVEDAPREPLAPTLDRPPEVVAIVGRPNVGKSSLFNRLTVTQTSIVEAVPGVTRDRVYGECLWNGREFTLIDTGGMVPEDSNNMVQMILAQARRAIEDADLVLFVVDVTAGIHAIDLDVAQILRESKRPVMLVANKVDSILREADTAEFWAFALGEPYPVSATHGLGTGDLLDDVITRLKEMHPEDLEEKDETPPLEEGAEPEWDGAIRVAIVGRPNVGKSSLCNMIVGDQRSIVHDVPGTTRDSLDTPLLVGDQRYVFIDTAGMRRKSRVDDSVEFYSTVRAERSIRRCDVAFFVLDADAGIITQDKKVAGIFSDERKCAIIVVNKWDLVVGNPPGRDAKTKEKEFIATVRDQLDFLHYAPIIFTSTLEKWGAGEIFPLVNKVYEQFSRRVETSTLNRVIQDAYAYRPPPSYKGQTLKISYCYQDSSRPPSITMRVNSEKLLHFSYKRYLENKLRQAFGFDGTPIDLKLKKK